jgi:hypothetical protein
MRPTVVLSFGACIIGILAAFVPSYGRTTSSDYSHETITQLIDDLTQIDSESPGISFSVIYVGFAAEDTSASAWMNTRGVAPPEVPPQMRELIRRDPLALPELIKHREDKRLTKLEVGGYPHVFSAKIFGYEYDPRVRDPEPTPLGFFHWTQKDFASTYTLKVGDICYALIGQIVNRHLYAVRLQPTGFLVVNSPIEVPDLIEKVESDWGSGDAETLKASLLADIHGANRLVGFKQDAYIEWVANPALRRLKLYFPEDYRALPSGNLPRKADFERSR